MKVLEIRTEAAQDKVTSSNEKRLKLFMAEPTEVQEVLGPLRKS